MAAGLNGSVAALAVSGGDLYAGGVFIKAGDTTVNYIAKWNGNTWSALGSGMGGGPIYGPSVSALALSGSDLYAGGSFTTAGGVSANCIAKWNGSSWSALGLGMGYGSWTYTPRVDALAVSGSDLYAGGYFTNAGGIAAHCIAKWDGSSWLPLGSGMGGDVYALAVAGSNLYVGGRFTTAGGSAATNIAKWNGSNWSALGSGLDGPGGDWGPYVNALAVSGSALYAGGYFTTAGRKVSAYVAEAVFVVPSPVVLQSPTLSGGVFSASFTNTPGASFRAVATTNLNLPLGTWPVAGSVTEVSPGQFQFTDPQATNGPQRYYRIRWP